MPVWSFTAERLAKLQEQIAKKKEEHDALLALSEKDLWCADLDSFSEEWDRQLRLDAEIQTNINRMGRRVSKKLGAGRGRKAVRDDDDYDPSAAKKGKAKAKAAPKVETKTHQRFAEMFSAKPKPKPKEEDEDEDVKSDFSDDDFAAFTAKTSAPKKSESVEPSETAARGRRAAASKPKTWIVDESDSDGDNMLGDIDNMVKGIGKQPEGASSKGRVSLFSMAQSGAGKDLPKTKSKPSRTFDFSDDDTNYEMLAKSSPRKSIKGDDDIDQFLSDDGFASPAPKAPAPKAPTPVAPPKKRGRPAAAAKAKPEKKKEVLSPAAKAYAKKAARKPASEEEDEEMDESIAPRRPARAARAARATKAKPKYVDSDEEDDSFQAGGDSDDPFGMDSD